MADIEDRAEKYAKDHAPTRVNGVQMPPEHHHQLVEILRDAYLAGSAQTQADYCKEFLP
jgi:hypothetical protein